MQRLNMRKSGSDRASYIVNGEEIAVKVPYSIHKFKELNERYKNVFRIHFWKTQGKTKSEVARILQIQHNVVERNWNIHPSQINPPRGVAPYVREYELFLLKIKFEPFKPVQLIRNFAPRTGLYNILRKELNWVPAVLRKRNKDTGTVTVTQKKTGKRMNCSFRSLRTGVPALDELLESVRISLNIQDPDAYLVCNYYANGRSTIGNHQHDFWSAILTFGASRVMLVDNRPVVLHDGDLIVLGTQKHGIPKQPHIKQGRVSIAVFYHPERSISVNGKVPASLQAGSAITKELSPKFLPMKEPTKVIFEPSSPEPDLGVDPLSALYENASKKALDPMIPALSNNLDEDEQLALALYLSEVENAI